MSMNVSNMSCYFQEIVMINKSAIIYYGGFLSKSGGVFSHVMAIEKELLKTGWDVAVITLDSLPIWCRYVPHLVEKIINFIYRPLGFLYKGRITRVLYNFFLKKRTDLCIFEDIYISWNSEVPSITILHAAWSDNLQAYSVSERQVKKLKKYEAEIINSINQPVVTVSYPYLEYLEKQHFSGSLSKKIDVIELGVDQSKFKHNPVMNIKSIVYSGSLEARKNVLFLLKVFKKLTEIDSSYKLTLIGDGPERKGLLDFVETHGLAVNFLGRLSHEKVLSELNHHGIYLHTSTKESFSYSLLEAKLAGLKTCAYDKLQVPPEFIDMGISSFNIDEWCSGILNIDRNQKAFDASNYTVKKMTLSTLRLAR